ncbi:class I SAM-dependent methyltransferase [Arthrobacter sp. zg-Y820]|uniref:class I SAM-dependent methyltransferase n=1 Tax=unclassified Arthrobacter TaxID=235627 RepID=UPI002540EEB8|nr:MULTISPECIES: class I SAM-dependent methyltransferase [unclassified Arthrobacter]MCC9196040.1 class I SAM-dependent methyltransferase [Arthrobacter sp. zg-Y820]MDK1278899.1 class I SAM-dependent methyltransferase [Arthrobacter sp. zg.Y820]WIB08686.1 class I SAM-dependent methyltransferase [Arthrobacter sp. zg-Y820]
MAGTTSGPRLEAVRRRQLARSYEDGGEHYDRIRPGYPSEAVQWLFAGVSGPAAAPGAQVADIGAGTGKYTRCLVSAGYRPTAVDPSADMLSQLQQALPGIPVVVGTAEDTGLPTASMDAATVAQAWHWCDPLASSTELARVLRPGGFLGLIWNQLDVSVPWVHRYSRIIHAGDVLRPGFRPAVGPEFVPDASHTTHWSQQMTPEDLMELAKSRSYYLSAAAPVREKVMANLTWYLFEHLGHRPGEPLELPYLTLSWRMVPAARPAAGLPGQ